jgi:hypothetical protein
MKSQRVIAHVDSITLKDVTYPVSQAGRARVLAERRKNVHAYVQGIVVSSGSLSDMQAYADHVIEKSRSSIHVADMKEICYNPYKKAFFFYCSNGREVKNSKYASITHQGVFAL